MNRTRMNRTRRIRDISAHATHVVARRGENWVGERNIEILGERI